MRLLKILSLGACFISNVCLSQTVIRVNVENAVVSQYLDEVYYTKESGSSIFDYMSLPEASDISNPAVVNVSEPDADSLLLRYSESPDFDSHCDSVWVTKEDEAFDDGIKIYNLVPGCVYFFELYSFCNDSVGIHKQLIDEGRIETSGRVRMINARSVRNVRDLGGWETSDGKRIRYGKLYRGRELNGTYTADSADIELLKHLGIEAEIDLRHNGENAGSGISAFGFLGSEEIDSDESATYLFTNNSGCCELTHLTYNYWQQRYYNEFKFIIEKLREGKPVYYHCVDGADRVGMLSTLLEGMLGVTYDNMVKDFELSAFYIARSKEMREFIFDYIESLTGSTLQDKFCYYLKSYVHLSQSDINYLISELLEEKPVSVGISGEVLSEEANKSGKAVNNNECYDLLGRRVDGQRRAGKTIFLPLKK